MRWPDLLIRISAVRWRRRRAIEWLADDLADKALAPVWARVRKQIGRMTAWEARGYVRARAATIIYRQVEARMLADSLPDMIRARLVERVMDRVVEQALREASAVETLGALARAA